MAFLGGVESSSAKIWGEGLEPGRDLRNSGSEKWPWLVKLA